MISPMEQQPGDVPDVTHLILLHRGNVNGVQYCKRRDTQYNIFTENNAGNEFLVKNGMMGCMVINGDVLLNKILLKFANRSRLLNIFV